MCAHYCCGINVITLLKFLEKEFLHALYIDSKTGRFSIVIWGRRLSVGVFMTVDTEKMYIDESGKDLLTGVGICVGRCGS